MRDRQAGAPPFVHVIYIWASHALCTRWLCVTHSQGARRQRFCSRQPIQLAVCHLCKSNWQCIWQLGCNIDDPPPALHTYALCPTIRNNYSVRLDHSDDSCDSLRTEYPSHTRTILRESHKHKHYLHTYIARQQYAVPCCGLACPHSHHPPHPESHTLCAASGEVMFNAEVACVSASVRAEMSATLSFSLFVPVTPTALRHQHCAVRCWFPLVCGCDVTRSRPTQSYWCLPPCLPNPCATPALRTPLIPMVYYKTC